MGFCWQEAAADRKQRAAKAATDRAEYERAHARLAEHAERHRLECAAALAIQCAATLFELLAWSIWMLLSAVLAMQGCGAWVPRAAGAALSTAAFSGGRGDSARRARVAGAAGGIAEAKLARRHRRACASPVLHQLARRCLCLTCHVLCWQDEESSPEVRGERERPPLWAPRQAVAAPAAAVALESVSETAPAVAWEGLLRGAKP